MRDADTFIIDELTNLKGKKSASITSETSIKELELDSLDVLELVMALEDRYRVDLDPADLGGCVSVGDVELLIDTLLSKA